MTSFLATLYCEESGCASMYLVYLCLLFCSYQIQSANRSYNRQKMAPFSTCCGRAHTVQNSEVNIMKLSELLAEAHFASKNTLLKRNTLHCYIFTVNNYMQFTGMVTGENFAFFIYRHFVEIL